MSQTGEIPLILGGHSFIKQLGNDPAASEQEQRMIVETCLEHGIRWFDTTYQPERVALGKVLNGLGRRDEARIFAWNFFRSFTLEDQVGEAEYYRAEHIEIILEELRTSYVDCLVMASLDDPEQNQWQEQLLIDWQKRGYVRALGLWISDPLLIERYQQRNPFKFAIRPFNVGTPDAASIFAACKKSGWETLATSPFGRGWELDRMIAKAVSGGYGNADSLRPLIADLMLRFSLFQSNVDRVIVAMRNSAWVGYNCASVSRGPLTVEELRWLNYLGGQRNTKRHHYLWQTLRRWF
jgi:aryl-alcohol dehydrogenase-like predicted oxidoreductase